MGEPELLLLLLMLAVGGLSVLAGAVRVPYPIVLVLGGLVLGFVPGVPSAELPPELVLVRKPQCGSTGLRVRDDSARLWARQAVWAPSVPVTGTGEPL